MTFIEVMTVLAIIAILAAFAVPNLVRSLPKYRVKAAAREVAGFVQQARMKAIKSGLVQFLLIDFGAISPIPISPSAGPPNNFTDIVGNNVPIGLGHTNQPSNSGQIRIIQDDFPVANPVIGDFFAGDGIPTPPGPYQPYPAPNWPFDPCCQNDVTVDSECVNQGGPFCGGTDSLSPYEMVDITMLPGNDDYKNVIISQVTDAAGNNFPLPQFGGGTVANGPIIVFDIKGFTCLVGDISQGGFNCNPQRIQNITGIIILQETVNGTKAAVTVFGSGGFAIEMIGQEVL
jgi:type II secretory pathway pseudopilin PulG